MVGEFFREAAVLLVIFVPLELWKSQSGQVNFNLMMHVGGVSLIILVFGIFLEWGSLLATRIKRDLEASYGSNSLP